MRRPGVRAGTAHLGVRRRGADANPCSRPQPCLTFAGAFAKTAAYGEMSCLDPGEFGPLTITKSVTINCNPRTATVQASGTNSGITVQASATDAVVIRGIDIETGPNGVGLTALSAASVTIEDSQVGGVNNLTSAGISIQNTGTTKVAIVGASVANTYDGILIAPGSGGITNASIRRAMVSGSGYDGISTFVEYQSLGVAISETASVNNADAGFDNVVFANVGANAGIVGAMTIDSSVASASGSVVPNTGRGPEFLIEGGGLISAGQGSAILVANTSATENSVNAIREPPGPQYSSYGTGFTFGDNLFDGNTILTPTNFLLAPLH